MELFIIIGVLIVAVVILARITHGHESARRKVFKNDAYAYVPKPSVMSPSEAEFFWRLQAVVQNRYFIFPQMHLSSLLDHRVKGQEWKYALWHINGKSVDYVLCDKRTLRPVYAIELDDPSHDRPDRVKRDKEVERIFEEADLPLVRFREYKNLSAQDIATTLAGARKLTQRSE
ncbi:DUF2726 domain-containing protein [Candidatus Saccharibacteria bacterium]|nr:DUF2726 domain-containing protein [Candidatus Saccharibacteria bacterium]